MTPGMTPNFQQLKSEVTSASRASNWFTAVREWEVVGLEEDHSGSESCICGQPNLTKLFTIQNRHNGRQLFPIGSTCINNFGRRDLDDEVHVLEDMLKLRRAILAGEHISVDSKYFTRALLRELKERGAFPGDRFNGGRGESDYEFLLDYFNARDKDAYSTRRKARVTAIMLNKVFPFVRDYDRIS
jgi:hypothetical protein